MDPDANLEAALERAREIIALIDSATSDADERLDNTVKLVGLANELAELVVALDEWLGKGGFLPAAWSKVAWPNGVTLAQAIVLGSKVKALDTMHVTMGGQGLNADEYLYVSYTNDPFVLGIDREGRASS